MFRNEFVAASAADFQAWILASAGIGAVLLVLGSVAGMVAGKRRRATR